MWEVCSSMLLDTTIIQTSLIPWHIIWSRATTCQEPSVFPLTCESIAATRKSLDGQNLSRSISLILEIPKQKKERQKLHKLVDETLLKAPEFHELHSQFPTKIALAVELIEQARSRKLPFTTVLMDSWYLAPDIVATMKEYQLDWVSLLKKNRKFEVHSFVLRDEAGQPMTLTGPHIKVEELVPLIPANAYRKVKMGEKSYWCFTRSLRVPGLGKVRLVISFENPELTGTYAVLVSNRTDWSAQKILASYIQRWPIETFYQDEYRDI